MRRKQNRKPSLKLEKHFEKQPWLWHLLPQICYNFTCDQVITSVCAFFVNDPFSCDLYSRSQKWRPSLYYFLTSVSSDLEVVFHLTLKSPLLSFWCSPVIPCKVGPLTSVGTFLLGRFPNTMKESLQCHAWNNLYVGFIFFNLGSCLFKLPTHLIPRF